MRQLIRLAVLLTVAQPFAVAFAQSDTGTQAGAYNAGAGGMIPPGYKMEATNPSNCGTPDDPKPCPPMPTHDLRTYPGPGHHRMHGEMHSG